MREIRTSGSMSGDGKRSVAAWPKLPRPSSTLPLHRFAAVRRFGRDRSEADMPRASEAGRSDENDPSRTLDENFTVTHSPVQGTLADHQTYRTVPVPA